MTRVLVIPSSGDPYVKEVSGLADYQAIVGGYIENIPSAIHDRATIYANEDGRQKGLPFNLVASAVAGRTLVGTVVVCGLPRGEKETDVPQDIVDFLSA